MQKVLTAAQMREVDRLTTERYGIPSILLMENAAHAVARVITEKLGGSVKGKSILILCGKGNNGGDGAALGRILAKKGATVSVELFGTVSAVRGDARINLERVRGIASAAGLSFGEVRAELDDNGFDEWLDQSEFDDSDVLVDALFGTGLSRNLNGFFALQTGTLANWKRNGYGKPLVVSVDVPSGLNADAAEPPGDNIDAHVTVTFTAPKTANVLPPASRFNGELVIADIGSPIELLDEQSSQLYLVEKEDAVRWMEGSRFSVDSYKNKRGHALLVAGSEEYSGAAVLCGNAAMRSGVGLVTLACPAEAKMEIASRLLPDVILSTLGSENFDEILGKTDAIAVGCGLDANDEGIERVVRNAVENRTKPVIVDAGALWFFNPPNGLLQKPAQSKSIDLDHAPLILTPHEGEFMRLLGTVDKDAIKDRVAAVRNFAQENKVILVLKGERVLIGHPDGRVVVNPTGNSGLGKAGNGDTLTGILAGFVAQAVAIGIDLFETVVAAVYIAGLAGDIAEQKYGKRVMTASDVRECLADAFNQCESQNG